MPRKLGKYRLVRQLATGGMGEVFLAQQEGPAKFSKTVVVKRLLRHLATDRSLVDMFQNEARLAALVSHPNVVQIFELGEEDGTNFIAMEYVRGRSLRDLMRAATERGGSIPVPLSVHIVAQILHGLEAAHALVGSDGRHLGLVHRDVTPENVLVSFDGPVKLSDFGIAKAQSLTATGRTTLRGKFPYMAPEQYRHAELDARTDIYASGVVLYELLAGHRPFDASNEAAVMHAILTAEPTPLLHLGRGISPGISAAVDRALSKDPDDRFPNAEAMAVELEACLAEIGTSVPVAAVRAFMREHFADAGEIVGEVGATLAVTEPFDPSPPRRARRSLVIGAATVATVAAAGTAGALHIRRNAAVESSISMASSTAPAEPARAGASPPSQEPAPLAASVASPEPTPSASSIAAASTTPAERPAAPSDRHARSERKPAARSSSTTVASGTGMLSLRIRPWAEVIVDGRSFGVSPLPPIELPAGRHVVVLRNPDLRAERKMFADVTPGATSIVRADLFE